MQCWLATANTLQRKLGSVRLKFARYFHQCSFLKCKHCKSFVVLLEEQQKCFNVTIFTINLLLEIFVRLFLNFTIKIYMLSWWLVDLLGTWNCLCSNCSTDVLIHSGGRGRVCSLASNIWLQSEEVRETNLKCWNWIFVVVTKKIDRSNRNENSFVCGQSPSASSSSFQCKSDFWAKRLLPKCPGANCWWSCCSAVIKSWMSPVQTDTLTLCSTFAASEKLRIKLKLSGQFFGLKRKYAEAFF